tara:strand:+ start:5502 stop:5705 length:204 start_codon:yes stop_codon:yes gene_type:complete
MRVIATNQERLFDPDNTQHIFEMLRSIEAEYPLYPRVAILEKMEVVSVIFKEITFEDFRVKTTDLLR